MGNQSPAWLIFVAIAFLVAFTSAAFATASNWKNGFLFLISGGFGFILKYGKFGFTCTFRTMLDSADMKQMRDLIMFLFWSILLCNIIPWFGMKHPLFDLKAGSFDDSGNNIGVSLALGAFIFGIGMNIGSGCASGTLVGLGEGFLKSWEVIWFFIAGATLGSTDPAYKWWSNLPKTKSIIYVPWWANFIIIVSLYFLTYIVDIVKLVIVRRSQSSATLELQDVRNILLNGSNSQVPWYKQLGNQLLLTFLLALPIGLFYLCTGGMIGVMGTFAKIGAYVCSWFGAKPENWAFFKRSPLPKSMMYDKIFLSDIFLALGAFLASSIARNFGVSQKKGWIEYTIGILGGLLMGFGARMAGGCNIGAMLSGITSNSISGYVWMFCAILGNAVPIYIRMFFEKREEKKKQLSTYLPIQ